MAMFSPSQAEGSRRNLWIAQPANRVGTPARLELLALAPLLLWLLFNWFQTIRAMVRGYNPLPVWDYWRVVQYFDRYKAFDFSVLWVQHNEHRIVFPEIIFASDMLFFHGCKLLPLVTSFVCYFFVWIILCAALRSDKTIPPLVYGAGVLLSGIIVGWQGCVAVLGDAFLLQWTMLQLAVVLGLFLLANTKQYESPLYLTGTILCGVVATYSSGSGMLLWPILILGALSLRLPKLWLLSLITAAVISVSLYFVGYQSSNNLDLLAILKHPFYFIGFVASYVSMPFGALGTSPFTGIAFGTLNLAIFAAILTAVLRNRLLTAKTAIVFVGGYLFLLASAILISAGRMNPADSAFTNAKVARYITLPLVNWAVLVLAMIWLSSRQKWKVFSSGSLIFVAALALLSLFLKFGPWLNGNSTLTADQQGATLSIESGLFNRDIIGKLFPDPSIVKAELKTLQKNRLSIYSDHRAATWIGRSARVEFPGTWKNKQLGTISRMIPITGGVEVVGRGIRVSAGTKLVLLDNTGRIVGLGERLPAGVPTVLNSVGGSIQQDWVGFINTGYHSKAFVAYAVSGRSLIPETDLTAIPST